MVFQADEALKRAIKFFMEKPTVGVNKMGLYNDPQSDRQFVNVFLASHVQSKKNFKFNKDYMHNWIPLRNFDGQPNEVNFAQKPIVLFKFGEHFEHPLIENASREINEKFQETKRVGDVLIPFDKPDKKGSWRGVGEIVNGKVKEFLRSLNTDEVPMFTSPQVAYTGPDYDIKHAIPMHLALTDDPAFPPEISMITGVCEGPEDSCLTKLATATANKAGDDCFVCFGDAIRDCVFNNAKQQEDNTSLKILSFSNTLSNMPEDNSKDASGQQTEQVTSKTPAQISQEIMEKQAKDAVSKVLADHNKRVETPEKADPIGTFDKAYGNESNQEESGKPEANNIVNPEVEALKKELAAMKLKDRKQEIAKRIPVVMVTDVKSGGINEKLLNEVVDYWVNTDKTPEDIGEFLGKQMAQIELVQSSSAQKVGKASNSDSFSDADLVSNITNTETQFDAPDVDNSSDNEKIANASANKDAGWFMDFAGMMVSTNVSQNVGKGSPRRMLQ